MQQVYEHIREDEDLMIDFMKIIREIENAEDPKRHPDTRKEKQTEKKLEVIQLLVDIADYGDRKDKEDSFVFPLYYLQERSENFRKELVDYLITYDTLPRVPWYPKEDENERLLEEIERLDLSLECCLFVARNWFDMKLR